VDHAICQAEDQIAIARVDDLLYAFEDLCTCSDESCPLSVGMLTRTTIMCLCHGSRFDIATGAVLNGPAIAALNLYEVQILEGSSSNPSLTCFDLSQIAPGSASVDTAGPVRPGLARSSPQLPKGWGRTGFRSQTALQAMPRDRDPRREQPSSRT